MTPFPSAFVGTAMALCVAASSVPPVIVIEPSDTFVVPKTVVSSNMRFVFAVGVEGTGHHYFVDVLHHLFHTNPHLVQISRNGNVNNEPYAIHLSMGGNAQHYNTELCRARKDMRKLGQRGEELDFPGTVVSMGSRNSYPNGNGPNKALKYVDLRLLAEVAEEEGVDLRVVYLRRRAKDLIIADTNHRHIQR